MVYLILAKDTGRILHISETLEYQDNGYYLINNATIAIPPDIADMVEVEALPAELETEKWLYVNGEFKENPDLVDPTLETDASQTIDELLTEMEAMLDAE